MYAKVKLTGRETIAIPARSSDGGEIKGKYWAENIGLVVDESQLFFYKDGGKDKSIDWEQRRYEIAKDILCALIEIHYNCKKDVNLPSSGEIAIDEADALIRLLKN